MTIILIIINILVYLIPVIAVIAIIKNINEKSKIDQNKNLNKDKIDEVYIEKDSIDPELQALQKKEKVVKEYKDSKIVIVGVSVLFVVFIFTLIFGGEWETETSALNLDSNDVSLIVIVILIIFLIAAIVKFIKAKKEFNILKQSNPDIIKKQKINCDNSCVEEGSDIFAEKREEGKIAFRNNKKDKNKKLDNGKKYCKHCGAELLYNENKCDWCGEDQ